LAKDTAFGPFADEWKRAFGDISKDVEEVDIAPALSAASFSIKGPEELVCLFLVWLLLSLSITAVTGIDA
jgi:hypothetical protein